MFSLISPAAPDRTCRTSCQERDLTEPGGRGWLKIAPRRAKSKAKEPSLLFRTTRLLPLGEGEDSRASRRSRSSARARGAGRGGAWALYLSAEEHTESRLTASKTRCPGAGCLAGAAEAAFLAQSEKGALIGQRDPAVVGRKESRRLIGRSAPAMRQAAVGVEGFRVNGCGLRGPGRPGRERLRLWPPSLLGAARAPRARRGFSRRPWAGRERLCDRSFVCVLRGVGGSLPFFHCGGQSRVC